MNLELQHTITSSLSWFHTKGLYMDPTKSNNVTIQIKKFFIEALISTFFLDFNNHVTYNSWICGQHKPIVIGKWGRPIMCTITQCIPMHSSQHQFITTTHYFFFISKMYIIIGILSHFLINDCMHVGFLQQK
jgi:hypothetical protein